MRKLRLLAALVAVDLTLGLLLLACGVHVASGARYGERNAQVCGVQWMLAGHKPSVYPWLRTYQGPVGTRCYFNAKTFRAVKAAKRRLGFKVVDGVAGRDFRDMLQGRRARPIGYVIRAARVAAADRAAAARRAAANTVAAKAVRIAERELSYGVHEIPDGSNWSPRIAVYQSFTGAYRAPWCASFTQAVYSWASAGRFADRSAGVFYIVGWARARGYLRATPRPGDLVAFVDRLGHIGVVERVVPGGIYSIEGNASNRVLRRYHPLANERPKVYIHLPVLERRAS